MVKKKSKKNMAARILSHHNILIKSFQRLSLSNPITNNLIKCDSLIKSNLPILTATRNTSFFNKCKNITQLFFLFFFSLNFFLLITVPADNLWKGVTSVSNAGKKRGRGKGVGKKMAKDLNKGQMIGVGKVNILWPGLNAPIIRGRELVQQQRLPEDPEREAKLRKIRDSMGNFRVFRMSPMDRGWSGSRMPGRSIGAPDPIGEDVFEGFDTKVLELKTVFIMKGNMGRKRRLSSFVVTGNGKGLAK